MSISDEMRGHCPLGDDAQEAFIKQHQLKLARNVNNVEINLLFFSLVKGNPRPLASAQCLGIIW
jgi:hypothetical protein